MPLLPSQTLHGTVQVPQNMRARNKDPYMDAVIRVEGARQNNLKHITVEIPLNKMTVVTGVSGSGKSSLVFDTVYAEGQRRYIETFSAYTRQFLERMDKPQVDRILGIPPAVAIEAANPVRTSRSTVGTMTEINDYLKILYAHLARLYCKSCGKEVRKDTPDSVLTFLRKELTNAPTPIMISFTLPVPSGSSPEALRDVLKTQGYSRFLDRPGDVLEVIQDRILFQSDTESRTREALETAFRFGKGQLTVYRLGEDRATPIAQWKFSTDLHCADCDIHYREPFPNFFSFNSPLGACPKCRGFGRIIDVDYEQVIPDDSLTLREGAIKPWQTDSYGECQEDLVTFARKRGIPLDTPWKNLTDAQKQWVIEGEGSWEEGKWYGVKRFFEWLESRAYKMHIRVLLSRYRDYRLCPLCKGARLQEEALFWRLGGSKEDGGLNIHELASLPLRKAKDFLSHLSLSSEQEATMGSLLHQVLSRLTYLVEVGLGYLTLDRQSRTLSGGELQRINLTTALGSALVNTLFVLDEPSIGLHPRDIQRLIHILHLLRDNGNTLLVVEHDPEVIQAADYIIDMGPGPGQQGGQVVFAGPKDALLSHPTSLTAQYLRGEKRAFLTTTGQPPTGQRETHTRRQKAASSHPEPNVAQPTGLAPRASQTHSPGNSGSSQRDSFLRIEGATVHNLKNLSLTIPLHQFVVISGVSGSGKSTLLEEVLYPNLERLLERAHTSLRNVHRITGYESIDRVIFVDQKPIGKSSRSNPVSYIGAYDGIRKLFASLPLAKERGFNAGTFSFNAGSGRCPTCEGKGFERVEMQFLSDVYLRCPACDGKRFREEVREVLYLSESGKAFSIADVLDLTVEEALEVFQGKREITEKLGILQEVGLGYLRLGQGVPTLSGGEAQRLKLAGYLAEARGHRESSHILFLLDEPTTGLHFEDIAVLLRVLRKLIDAGHSLIVIEHNLDMIASADYILDLGPEGGEEGGRLVAEGPVESILSSPSSHTACSLRAYLRSYPGRETKTADHHPPYSAELASEAAPPYQPSPFLPNPPVTASFSKESRSTSHLPNRKIIVRGAREHNLKHITTFIPLDRFTVITGVSGSGKSTLAFDILFAEGQRRYLETLNAYARQFIEVLPRPDVEEVLGVPPTVSIEQHTSRGGRKSTVATVTEIYHFLRLWFTKLGTYHCPRCQVPIVAQTPESIIDLILRALSSHALDPHDLNRFSGATSFAPTGNPKAADTLAIYAPLVVNRKGIYNELASWAKKQGYPFLRVDGTLYPTDAWPLISRYREHSIDLPLPVDPSLPLEKALKIIIPKAIEIGKGSVRVSFGGEERLYSTKRICPSCGTSFPEPDPRLFSFNSKHGWCPRCYGTGLIIPGFDESQTGEEIWWNEWYEGEEITCPTCKGKRLRPEALAVTFQGYSISDITALSVKEAIRFFSGVRLEGRDLDIGKEILPELLSRLSFLEEVGLSYLTLDRSAPSLSGGESRRVRLAAQLGSNLRGVCYILDEPTIGLHSRDNDRLLSTLRMLQKKGNTLLVVEHDEQTIRQADHVIDLGPGGGIQGGEILAEGSPEVIAQNPQSITGFYLTHPLPHPLRNTRRPVGIDTPRLWIRGATLHNLKGIDVAIPLGRFVVVTGVSGSGKSTLVRDILRTSLQGLIQKGKSLFFGCRSIEGWEPLSRVLEVDQTPIGKTPRSCPATYIGFWDPIRKFFAELPESRVRGYTPSRFSFNVPGGRCPACEGQGVKRVEMSFLPEAEAPCEVCEGKRFEPETCSVLFRGKSIADVLAMNVDEAVEFFSFHPTVHHALKLMQEVGLGYLTLGQPSPTLSGGESQRLKLVTELARIGQRGKRTTPSTLYILDEPTIGLHTADIEKLLSVLHRIVDAGHSLLIIEHNLDLIAEADWIIDLGPEGGDEGGYLVAEGTPEDLVNHGNAGNLKYSSLSYTRQYLEGKLKGLTSRPATPGTPGDSS